MTPEEIAEIKERVVAITKGPFKVVAGDNCGHYGSGPDTREGFVSYAVVDGEGRVIVDTYNSTVTEVHEDVDEDGSLAWDEVGRRNAAFFAHAPIDIRTVLEALEASQREVGLLKRMETQATKVLRDSIDRNKENGQLRCQLAEAQAALEASQRLQARWKAAIEGLTPHGSEYVDDPEACAVAIRQRTQWPKQIIELRSQLAEAREEIEGVLEALGPLAVRVRENGGPEDIYASLALSVARLSKSAVEKKVDASMPIGVAEGSTDGNSGPFNG